MQERVASFYDTLNKHIDTTSEYANEEDGDDFIKDDVSVPTGYEDEGEYFGLQDNPDIDDVINSENNHANTTYKI